MTQQIEELLAKLKNISITLKQVENTLPDYAGYIGVKLNKDKPNIQLALNEQGIIIAHYFHNNYVNPIFNNDIPRKYLDKSLLGWLDPLYLPVMEYSALESCLIIRDFTNFDHILQAINFLEEWTT